MSGIASFITGAIEGRERRRTWDDQDKDRDWKKDRRGRQLVLDGQDDTRFGREQTEWGQKDEDRLSDNAWKDESRGNERGNWKEQDTLFGRSLVEHAQSDEDRFRRHKEEDYDLGRKISGNQREDAIRATNEGVADAYGQAVAADNSVAPIVPDYAPPAAPGPAPAAPATAAPAGRSLTTTPAPQSIAGKPDMLEPTFVPPAEPQAGRLEAAAQVQPAATTAAAAAPAPTAAAPVPQAPAPIPAPQGKSLPPTAEQVSGYADKISTSAMQAWRETEAPKLIQSMIAQGEPDKAERFETFIDSSQTKEAMSHWMRGMAIAEIQPAAALKEFAQAYNVRGYFDDGIEVVSDKSTIQRDPKTGRLAGVITFRDEQTGTETEMPFEGAEDLHRMAAGLLSPEAVFERGDEALKAADERRAKQLDEAGKPPKTSDREAFTGMRKIVADSAPIGTSPQDIDALTWEALEQFNPDGSRREAPAAAASDDVPVFMR